MKISVGRIALLALLVFFTACSAAPYTPRTISISGVIELPLPLDSKNYWIDSGPLFVSNTKPLITYRVISKEELEYAGSEKTVYEFLKSSFSDPEGVVEESFRISHDLYDFHKRHEGGIDIYILSMSGESKAYIASENMHIGVEVGVDGPKSNSIMNEIINNIKLTIGE